MTQPTTTIDNQLEQYARRIDSAKADMTRNIMEIGKHLTEARSVLAKKGNGTFIKWVEERCGFSGRTAQNMLNVYREFGECEKFSSSFDDSALYLLAAPSAPAGAKDAALELAAGGERVTHKRAKELVEANRPKLSPISQLPSGKYDVILADPPWQYESSTTDPTRIIENQYPTADLVDLIDLRAKLEPHLPEDGALFLWSTSPKLEEAIQLMNGWGYRYRTTAVWDKQRMGLGYWFRSQHEQLLVGVRGSFRTPAVDCRPPSILVERRSNVHSQKPTIVYSTLERMFPDKTLVELFAREPREGWQSWINDCEAVNERA